MINLLIGTAMVFEITVTMPVKVIYEVTIKEIKPASAILLPRVYIPTENLLEDLGI